MKIECSQEQLLDSVGLVEKISAKNPNLPVLTCILLEVKNKQLYLRSTNLDLGIEAVIPVKTTEEGVIAVPAHTFYNTISSTYGGQSIVLQTVKENLSIITATSKTLIKTIPHEDFPTLPSIKNPKKLHVKTEELLNGMRSVWYSASLSSIKPEQASVYLYPNKNSLIFVSTDSFRLAEKTVPSSGVIEFPPILIPLKALADLIRVFEYKGGEMEMHISDTQITFIFEKLYVTSRLIEGSFPDYKQIFPKQKTTEAIVLKQDLISAFKKLNIFVDRFNQVSFSVNPSKKILTLRAHNSDVGETVETVNAALSGEDVDINFNQKYVTDCFQSIHSDSISMAFEGISKPMVMRGVSDNTFAYLVMPMNR